MAIQQIVIIDEDGSKCTIRASQKPYQDEGLDDGKLCVEAGVEEPLVVVLKRVIKAEWQKVRAIDVFSQ